VLVLVLGAVADPRAVQAVNNQGCTAVWLAVSHGNTETVRVLVNEYGTNVNTANVDGMTPILVVAYNGHTTTVRSLVNECSAHVNTANENGMTPMHFTVSGPHGDCAREGVLRGRQGC
jgi:ankyrin repeat protein